ncbi:MAG: sulfur relay protein DsrC [Gammaproteobacteria bacterium]|nr:MAG: sulfur relay protein DsrC [Gammaproteobacteria bacterium]
MLKLSDILIQHHELASFEDLLVAVREAGQGEIFFRIDVRPPFHDTPEDWEDRLEAAFTGGAR